MPASIRLHPAAIDDARAAREWYEERNPAAAESFVVELDYAIDQISRFPNRWPSHLYGTRRFLSHRFPFSVMHREVGGGLEILAFAHASRRPAYWRSRT
jgi:plasmid stabilization system protein ParE